MLMNWLVVYVGSFLALLNSRERTNKRVSELFNTTPNTSWRSLKILTNSSASLFGPRSDLSGEVSTAYFPEGELILSFFNHLQATIQFPANSAHHWNSSVWSTHNGVYFLNFNIYLHCTIIIPTHIVAYLFASKAQPFSLDLFDILHVFLAPHILGRP